MRRINPETVIMLQIHEALLRSGLWVGWRNNCGMATYGEAKVRYGLGPGSPDLVGALRSSGRMCCFEVKTPKNRKKEDEQLAWHRHATANRIFVRFVRSAEEAVRAVQEAANGAD